MDEQSDDNKKRTEKIEKITETMKELIIRCDKMLEKLQT
jgi:hypothetical protein